MKTGKLLIIAIGGYMAYRHIKKQFFVDNAREIDILARTVYGEARGESSQGQQAVLSTILNRVKKGGWWGATIEDVCKKPWQFSCWNYETTSDKSGKANYDRIVTVTTADPTFAYIYDLSKSAVQNGGQLLNDYSNGATHYHARSVNPSWAGRLTKTAEIGNHIFYA